MRVTLYSTKLLVFVAVLASVTVNVEAANFTGCVVEVFDALWNGYCCQQV